MGMNLNEAHVQLAFVQRTGYLLSSTAAVADNSNALALQVEVVPPPGRVEHLSLKVLDPLHAYRLIKRSRKASNAGNEDVAGDLEVRSVRSLEVDDVALVLLDPDGLDKLRIELRLASQVVLLVHAFPICGEAALMVRRRNEAKRLTLLDLGLRAVLVGPLGVELGRKRVPWRSLESAVAQPEGRMTSQCEGTSCAAKELR